MPGKVKLIRDKLGSRPAIDMEQHRIFFCCIEIGWQQFNGIHFWQRGILTKTSYNLARPFFFPVLTDTTALHGHHSGPRQLILTQKSFQVSIVLEDRLKSTVVHLLDYCFRDLGTFIVENIVPSFWRKRCCVISMLFWIFRACKTNFGRGWIVIFERYAI